MTNLINDGGIRPTRFHQEPLSTHCALGVVAAMARNSLAGLCKGHHHSLHVVETLVQCKNRTTSGMHKIFEYAHFE